MAELTTASFGPFGAPVAKRAAIHATATDLPPTTSTRSEAVEKLTKYVNDRGGKRVRASHSRGRATSRVGAHCG